MLKRVTFWWYQPSGAAPRGPQPQTAHSYRSDTSSQYWAVLKKFASQSQRKYKKIIFFFPAKQKTA
jgi:hypothetical protein